MPNLYVIRHGMRLDHEDRSWRERAERTFDPPLSETGLAQAGRTAAYLRQPGVGEKIAAVYCSPFVRTVQTAHPIAAALDLPLRLEGGLSEWLNPKWHDFSAGLRPPADLQQVYPRIDLAYRPLVAPLYPEEEEAICGARCEFTARRLAAGVDGDVVLVTHGVCVGAIVRRLTAGAAYAVEQTCAVNILHGEEDGNWTMQRAVTEHLAEPEEEIAYI